MPYDRFADTEVQRPLTPAEEAYEVIRRASLDTIEVPSAKYHEMASAQYRLNQLRAWLRYPTDASAAARLLQLQSMIEPPAVFSLHR